jgi:hypothetical protein
MPERVRTAIRRILGVPDPIMQLGGSRGNQPIPRMILHLVTSIFINSLASQIQNPSLNGPFGNQVSYVYAFNAAIAYPLILRVRDAASKFIQSILNGSVIGVNHNNQPLFRPVRVRQF